MKTETVIAFVGLGTTMGGTLGGAFLGSWTTGRASLKLQARKERREDSGATEGDQRRLLVTATVYAASVHAFRLRWTSAATLLDRLRPRRALAELQTIASGELKDLLDIEVSISLSTAPDYGEVQRAAKELADAGADLYSAVGGPVAEYQQAEQRFQAALRETRQVIDARAASHAAGGIGGA